MGYKKRILCYFDILGFSEKVCNDSLDANTIEKLFSQLNVIIENYRQDNIIISHFSDSFVISIKHRTAAPTQLRIVVDILIKLLEYSLIARGAIVYGNISHTQDNIYGPAIVKAVNIERADKFPRILLDESLDELPLPTIGNAEITYRSYFNNFKFVKTDSVDNKFYIDFINDIESLDNKKLFAENIEKLIAEGSKHPQVKVAEKYDWLKEKYKDYLERRAK